MQYVATFNLAKTLQRLNSYIKFYLKGNRPQDINRIRIWQLSQIDDCLDATNERRAIALI